MHETGPAAAPRRVTVLGSTGSVGVRTLQLLEGQAERGAFAVEALVANRNAALLAEQARRVGARLAVVADPDAYAELRAALSGTGIEAAAGPGAVVEAARRPADWVMAAIVGAAGLASTLAAIERGCIVALANKEALVCAGALVMQAVRRHGATLLPVDSEHNAIFQVFDRAAPESVERLILTASGGPFRSLPLSAMRAIQPEQALAHPVWSMGAKISVDSATMMNKGLEHIEAAYLFPVPPERIEVLVHPQSIVHSLVGYVDGSVLAQLGTPDMRIPIAHTLAWPRRMAAPTERLDLAKLGSLTFEAPDLLRFPALRLAREALAAGAAVPAILNAANEEAVRLFLERRIGFLAIAEVVEQVLHSLGAPRADALPDLLALDAEARAEAKRFAAAVAA
ncbi:MAG: 1-deoxy-D-xylulose-5-phosphate reductoisomerase [Alphaproteobacteria bacterium]|nr:1-deoxy-D-xylulose-5-phosphate reductoisomerase [Alphaproteobacteria bacterium]